MVTYSNDSNTYALTVSELLSWDYRTYRFGTSYSYYYCEPTSEMPNRLANGNRGLVLHPDSLLNDDKRALLQTHFFYTKRSRSVPEFNERTTSPMFAGTAPQTCWRITSPQRHLSRGRMAWITSKLDGT
jgi:hypothetical protein